MKKTSAQLLKTAVMAAVLFGLGAVATPEQSETRTVKGEVIDVICYLTIGGKGPGHARCAATCIRSGGPVGLLTADEQVYLLVGDHKPINDKLVDFAGKVITVKGKVVERNGMKMVENVELEK
jgi:hypothetical protein